LNYDNFGKTYFLLQRTDFMKSEAGRETFALLGAKIFNKLPSNLKNESLIVKFKTACKEFNFDF